MRAFLFSWGWAIVAFFIGYVMGAYFTNKKWEELAQRGAARVEEADYDETEQ